MRRSLLLPGFLLSAVVLLAALAWISHLALGLEAREAEARRRAAFEERIRLSLWRMDSALAAFLAQENAEPAEGWQEDAADGGEPTPGETPRPYLAARFEIDPAGRVRLWAASPNALHRGAPALARDLLLAGLAGQTGQAGLPGRAGRPGPEEPWTAPAEKAPAARPARAERAAPAPAPAPAPIAKASIPVPKNDPVAREMLNQSLLNQAEFEQRSLQSNNSAASPLSASAELAASSISSKPDLPHSPAAVTSGGASPSASVPAAADSTSAEPVPRSASRNRAAEGAPARSGDPSRAAPRRPPGRVLSALSAVWLRDDLVLVRRVARGGGEELQGVLLDSAGVGAWLGRQVRDLLPRAALLPLRSGETADPGRRLALLPLRLDPGPLPALAAAESPLRLGLAVASAAVLLAIAAAGLLLAASLRLARRRADFVSAVTHELRTPLTTFRLYTEMLAGDMVPAAERPTYLGALSDEAGRLGHLVENVLAFARLERGRHRMAVEEVELATLVAEAAALLGPRAERAGLSLRTEMAPGAAAARVRVDRVAVDRILQNLVDNACKYGQSAEEPRLDLSARLGDRRAVITLRDHGSGLPLPDRRRLFRPFHRSAAEAAGAPPGVGLGLALSRRLARAFGGDLRAVEPTDGGAAFELRLPLAP